MPKLRTGPRGGKYYIKRGRKVYVSKKKSRSRKSRPRRRTRKKRESRSRSRSKRRTRFCTPGKNKKFAKVVNGKCIRFGDPNMTIKSNIPARRRSFCARHKCRQKRNPATPGYQSCKKWRCKTGK